MKKFLFASVLLFSFIGSYAQLNNSWINYNNTYYKFYVAKDTLCRISQTTLAAAGLGSVPAQNFQLWRNGQQVRIYTSVSTGVMGASDYIEFWGQMNDGKPDKPLYRNPDFQLDDKYSLFTDSAAYYLTVNTTGNNLRFTTQSNPVSGNVLPADAYFMRRIEEHYKSALNAGKNNVLGETAVYSSSFEEDEGWTSNNIFPCCFLSRTFTGVNKYTAGPANSITFTVNAAGASALFTRDLNAKIGSTVVIPQTGGISPMPYYEYRRDTIRNLPLSLINNNSTFSVALGPKNSSDTTGINDRIVVSNISITYPATFNFNNQSNFYFELQASAAGNYLVITNFSNNGVEPVLYDLNNGYRYVGDITVAGQVRFVLPPSSDSLRKFNLVSNFTGNILPIAQLTPKTFTNFANISNQGDYIIISNPLLYDNGSGVNNVEQYRQYRSSAVGGGYNAKVYDINELNEQFGFGIKNHPAAVRDFIRWAAANFTVKPKFVFIIGRAVTYFSYKANEYNGTAYNTDIDKMALVPTFGWPASDVLLACPPGTYVPLVPIGRLAAVNGNEVGIYLQKMKEYELAQRSTIQTISEKAWTKNMIDLVGGGSTAEDDEFKGYQNIYRSIAEDTLFGAHVESFSKTSSAAVQEANANRIADLFKEGLSFISYFGHSSSNTLGFNLNNPEDYQNQGKYPFLSVSGCLAGNFFEYAPLRLTGGDLSLSEKYVFENQKGGIAFFADTHFGIPIFLHYYNQEFYNQMCRKQYGGTVGDQLRAVLQTFGTNLDPVNFYLRIHLEELTLHGDPALRINAHAKPDYVIEPQQIKISPSVISVADNSFGLKVTMLNIGKAIDDSIRILVRRKLPNDTIQTIVNKKIRAIMYSDSVVVSVPINPITDKGLNKIIVTLDTENKVDELSESNNTAEKEFYIYENELRPVYPYNFSIVRQQNITFTASTANPLAAPQQYTMEIDTTEEFNSPLKKTYSATGAGGVIDFNPTGLTFNDSTVYYWRTAVVQSGSSTTVWNNSSFVYIPNSSAGFNQSHYYQHLKSSGTDVVLNPSSRKWEFPTYNALMEMRNGVYPVSATLAQDFAIDVNKVSIVESICLPINGQVIISAFSPINISPMPNSPSGPGLYGSGDVCGPTRQYSFSYDVSQQSKRIAAVNFIENIIPSGYYVVVMNFANSNPAFNTFPDVWKNDTLVLGSGKSLYHTLKSSGFATLDSLNRPRAFIYVYKKADNGFTPQYSFSAGTQDKLFMNLNIPADKGIGSITSPLLGPASSWSSFSWRGGQVETNKADSLSFDIVGITSAGTETTLYTVDSTQKTFNLSAVDAKQYPWLKLRMTAKDTVTGTPYQLRYWRVNYTPLPEGALAPNIRYSFRDTVDQGDVIDFKVAFKNISPTTFDSAMLYRLTITDNNNLPHTIPLAKGKVLTAGDTLTVQYKIDTKTYPGNNTLFLDINPNNDQAEQLHYNNVLFKDFYVKPDNYNPLLDVTFDGVHILNRDIVASKPHIFIKLKDESRFMALSDTSLLKVQVIFPDNSVHTYNFGDTMRFNPANLATGDNTASIDLMPYFTQDGDYQLVVSGKDVVGNKAGNLEYKVVFSVINKPMISNLLNYPNPFTTSTAFVFTLTGSEIPQNIRIQILTITGKVVREITKEELGPIHIGRNITEYKWDGTDTYGQKLANGVYLYRVLTNLNGQSLDLYKARGDKTDKYFTKGYGKLVILR